MVHIKDDEQRVSTPLELFFDLIFVVAVASTASVFHHSMASNHIAGGLWLFFLGFFAIFNAWQGYTWFASSYDTNDTRFKLMTMLQMVGALVLAVGINRYFELGMRYLVVIGYTVMRLVLWIQLYQAKKSLPDQPPMGIYFYGIVFLQLMWVGWLFISGIWETISLIILTIFEIVLPFVGGSSRKARWHPHHIAERFSLFFIIVLGEGILAATNDISALIHLQETTLFSLLFVSMSLMILMFSLWWLYFTNPFGEALHKLKQSGKTFVFNYGHYIVFCSVAAIGASLELIADVIKTKSHELEHIASHTEEHIAVSPLFAITVLSLSLAAYLISITFLRSYLFRFRWIYVGAMAFNLLLIASACVGVYYEMPIALAIAILSIAPIGMTVLFTRDTDIILPHTQIES